MRYIGWFALSLIVGTSPALAQKAAPADVAAIKACLKSATDKESFGGACIDTGSMAEMLPWKNYRLY